MMKTILQPTVRGLYCMAGDFYIDPRHPVKRAVITHAHADHARRGCRSYLCTTETRPILHTRIGRDADIQSLDYGETLSINGLTLSLHPAGHILGSAQIRIEAKGHVCVVSGDYKDEPDPTCTPLEPLRCHAFVSESTFGLPIFKWPRQTDVIQEIHSWWQKNRDEGRTSILFAYALGKAQRVLAGLDPTFGPILIHGAVEKIYTCYREAGIRLPAISTLSDLKVKALLKEALVVAPPSADQPAWLKRFPHHSRAFASGWMRIRGHRRRRAIDRGFVLSDHSGWDGLVATIRATGAEAVWLTHGYAEELARWLREKRISAEVLPTPKNGSDTHPGETP